MRTASVVSMATFVYSTNAELQHSAQPDSEQPDSEQPDSEQQDSEQQDSEQRGQGSRRTILPSRLVTRPRSSPSGV